MTFSPLRHGGATSGWRRPARRFPARSRALPCRSDSAHSAHSMRSVHTARTCAGPAAPPAAAASARIPGTAGGGRGWHEWVRGGGAHRGRACLRAQAQARCRGRASRPPGYPATRPRPPHLYSQAAGRLLPRAGNWQRPCCPPAVPLLLIPRARGRREGLLRGQRHAHAHCRGRPPRQRVVGGNKACKQTNKQNYLYVCCSNTYTHTYINK